jgi:Spy/CpxP family protein refolding chaperone
MSSAWYRLLPAMLVFSVAAPYAYEQNRPAQTTSSSPASTSTQSARPRNDGQQKGEPPPAPWWRDEQFKKEIALKDDQAAQIEKIWQETSPGWMQKYNELTDAERELSSQIAKDLPIGKVSNQIKLVEMARADFSATRQIMLYKMRSVLKQMQRTKFDAIHPRWQVEFDRRRAEWQNRRNAEQRQKPRTDAKPDPKPEPRKPF